MKVITSNKEGTVGICTDPDKIHTIGTFTPALLQEWVKMIVDMYGTDQEIQLFVRKSDCVEGFAIFASSNGENPFVVVAGRYTSDGLPWKDALC